VTPTYHREKLFDIALHSILSADYPRDKIEWVIVEDGTDPALSAREKIISFQLQVPELKIKYIPIEGKMTIGEKRNLGVEHTSHEIVLFMDDDDHYPHTSFRRRVAWLLCNDKKKIACCTTLALYDLIHGVSAVNVPPYHLPLSQRISEATLTFQKSAWRERPFSAVSMAEGEGWIEGRETEVLEFPCQQIIVAFTHHGNSSGRRIPPAGPPSCFWGFPQEYLVFIHELAGIEVEAVEEKKEAIL
jgi:glycosyltransferase involved in cell wall biosynthesis